MEPNLFPELNDIDGRAQTLMLAVPELLSMQSPELLDEEILKRKRFRTELKKMDAGLAKENGRIRDLRKLVDLADSQQSDDIQALSNRRWELINERRENRYTGNSGISEPRQ